MSTTPGPMPDADIQVAPEQTSTDVQAPAPSIPTNGGPAAVNDMAAAAQPTATPTQPGGLWKSIVAGALTGLAGGVGQTSFGGGMAGGALQVEKQKQLDTENQQKLAEQQSTIKFRDLQSASMAANLHRQDQIFQQQDEDHQDALQQHADEHAQFLKQAFGINLTPVNNTGSDVQNHLEQATANSPDGAHVPVGTIMGPHTIYVPDSDQSPSQTYSQLSVMGSAMGLPVPSQQQFTMLDAGKQQVAATRAQNVFMGRDANTGDLLKHEQLPSAISSYQTARDNYAAKDDADPTVLKQMDSTLTSLKGQLKANNDNDTQQAVSKANAEAPGKIATAVAETKAKQSARSDDDNIVATDPATNKSSVMKRKDAEDAGYFVGSKADTLALQGLSATADDVQGTVNRLANFVNSPAMAKVDPRQAATALSPDVMSVGAFGSHVSLAGLNAKLKQMSAQGMNQETQQYATLLAQAHEAATQVPRLQTLGKVNRNSQQQMEATQALFPNASDTPETARTKMGSVQDLLDPIVSRIPATPGAAIRPSWRAKQQ